MADRPFPSLGGGEAGKPFSSWGNEEAGKPFSCWNEEEPARQDCMSHSSELASVHHPSLKDPEYHRHEFHSSSRKYDIVQRASEKKSTNARKEKEQLALTSASGYSGVSSKQRQTGAGMVQQASSTSKESARKEKEQLTSSASISFSEQRQTKKITHEGGTIIGDGITLSIPPGAVPPSGDIDISLQACLDGPFCLPEDLEFMSPVYLIEPHYSFHKNVTLSIKMFLNVQTQKDSENTVFVTSPAKKQESCSLIFRKYGSPRFSEGSRYGEIELPNFCFCALARIIGSCTG